MKVLGQIHPPDVGAETNSRHDADAIRCYTTDIASCFIPNAGGGASFQTRYHDYQVAGWAQRNG